MIEIKCLWFTIDDSNSIDESIAFSCVDEGMLCTWCLNHSCYIASLFEFTIDRNEQGCDVGCDEMPAMLTTITRWWTSASLVILMANISVSRIDFGNTSSWIQSTHDLTIGTCISIASSTCTSDCICFRFVWTCSISVTATIFDLTTVWKMIKVDDDEEEEEWMNWMMLIDQIRRCMCLPAQITSEPVPILV